MPIRQLLRAPAVQRALVAIIAAIVALAIPWVLESAFFLLLGAVAVVVGLVETVGWWQTRHWRDLVRALSLVLGGVVLLIGGETADRFLALAVAAILAIRGIVELVHAYKAWRSETADPFWPLSKGIGMLLAATAIIVIPDVLFQWSIMAIAGSWIVGGLVVIINTIGEDPDTPVPDDVITVIREKSMPLQLRHQVTEAIFDGFGDHQRALEYTALMSFATAIATFGVKADSTAVVIGAMLIAPLMSPIMALSASILMGWPRRAFVSLRRVGLGVAIGVGGSFVLSLVSPEFGTITSNSQVLSRTAPTILDLMVALAAGAAGGYAVTHPKVGNSLPGVAIAVALAPPLAVVGYSLQQLEIAFALGAFLLFLTNLVGIIVAAGVTYVISGYSPWTHVGRQGDQGKRSLALVGLSLAMVAIPLAIIGDEIIAQTSATTDATQTVEEWLGEDSGYDVARVQVAGRDITVTLIGEGDLPSADDLAVSLAASREASISLNLAVTPRHVTVIDANPARVVSSSEDE